MARVTLGTGETITVGGVTEIFGTSGAQSVTVIDGSTITFRSGFNSGGDSIRLTGTASNFLASISGSNVTLFSAVDNITIVIPIGANANTIVFDNGDSRSLSLVGGVPTLGSQTLSSTPAALSAGPGTYSVALTGGDNTEGNVVTFTVTRTDTSAAQVLQYTVQGSTNGGTVVAATAGADFTAAGNSVSFAAGEATKTFTVALNTDNNVEGVEGLAVSVLSGATVVASTTGLILDANNVGQTFVLTPGLDRVGTGSALDLVGSEGSTSTVGQDTIIATQGDFNTFDNINGGAESDTLVVLDDGAFFTFPPNFTNVTIANVENLDYTSTRGFFGGALNTTGWTGLTNVDININGFGTQTLTMGTGTGGSVNQAGGGDLNVFGGGGSLIANATSGDVNVGTNGASNAFTSVTVTGGDDVTVQDNGAAELTTVTLAGFTDDANLSGSAISSVSVSNLSGGSTYRDVNVSATNVTVNLSNISVSDLDLTASNLLTVNAAGNTISGLDDITAGSNIVINSTAGDLYVDDVAANGAGRSVALNATGGNIYLDDLTGADVRNVTITGPGYVSMDSVTQSGNAAGTVITATNGGGVYIDNQLGNNTQFNGSGDTGSDSVGFGATTRANSFGAGSDAVYLNSAALGVGGSLDGGADYDTLFMESNNAAAFTSGGATATSNFEELYLTSQNLGTADVINLANIGFTGYPGANTTDVTSNVGATAPVTEVVTISFAGVSTWTDSVTFDGETAIFADNQSAVALATEFVADLGGSTANWNLTDNGDGTVTLTSIAAGPVTDLTAGSFVFNDATTLGTPGFEQSSPVVSGGGYDGEAPFAGTVEVQRLTLTNAAIAAGETITLTESIPGPDPAFTLTAPVDLSFVGGELATYIANAANADPDFSARWTASVSGNDVVFTATSVGNRATLAVSGTGLTGADIYSLTTTTNGAAADAGSDEDAFFLLDGVSTGSDQLVFDGVTITFSPTDDTPGELRTAFITQYNAAPVRTYTASNSVIGEPYGFLQTGIHLESNVNANLSDLTAADFQFVDDTNAGTPSVGVAVTTQGSNSSVTLNNFTSGSTLEITASGGTHIVNVNTNTANDVLNLASSGANVMNITANAFETVNFNTYDPAAGTETLNLSDTSLKVLTLVGSDDVDLSTNSTQISSIDASGLGGYLTWAADANTVAITVTTGSGGSDVDFSAMTIPGLAPITFLGGSGNDTVTLGGTGTSRATITTGAGNDEINVGGTDGGNDYSTILDFDVTNNGSLDKLDFGGGAFVATRDQVLEPTATFQDYLDQAANGVGAGDIHWFYWDGDTYVVQDNAAGEDFQDGADDVIKLEGLLDLTALNFV